MVWTNIHLKTDTCSLSWSDVLLNNTIWIYVWTEKVSHICSYSNSTCFLWYSYCPGLNCIRESNSFWNIRATRNGEVSLKMLFLASSCKQWSTVYDITAWALFVILWKWQWCIQTWKFAVLFDKQPFQRVRLNSWTPRKSTLFLNTWGKN